MSDKNGKLTAWEIVNGNLLAMKMKEQVYIEVCDWELETIRTELQKYTKYKRAFDILKEFVSVANLNGTYLLSVWVNILTPVCYLDKEQGELLEELMNIENTK